MPLTPERLAELRHVAEQAASLPNGPWAHRYLSEFIPGVVLELLDMIPEPAPVVVTPKPPCLTPDLCRFGGPCMVGSGCSDDPRPVWRINPHCIEAWPDCWDGGYDPHCCRWPKVCSCLEPVEPEASDAAQD